MAGLRALLESRASPYEENNLEKGKMWAYSNVATYSTYPGCFCWISPGTGTVEIEVFGAGGGGSRMCCCSATISGNSGAYSQENNYSSPLHVGFVVEQVKVVVMAAYVQRLS